MAKKSPKLLQPAVLVGVATLIVGAHHRDRVRGGGSTDALTGACTAADAWARVLSQRLPIK